MQTPNRVVRFETAVIRALMIVMALIAVGTGVALLRHPLAIPLTVGIWISAAAMAFLGIWGTLPAD